MFRVEFHNFYKNYQQVVFCSQIWYHENYLLIRHSDGRYFSYITSKPVNIVSYRIEDIFGFITIIQ